MEHCVLFQLKSPRDVISSMLEEADEKEDDPDMFGMVIKPIKTYLKSLRSTVFLLFRRMLRGQWMGLSLIRSRCTMARVTTQTIGRRRHHFTTRLERSTKCCLYSSSSFREHATQMVREISIFYTTSTNKNFCLMDI